MLSGRVALVTGASRGLGEAIASALAKAGASVAMCARNSEEIEHTAERLRSQLAAEVRKDSEARVLAVKGDVTDEHDVEEAVRRTVETLGGIDILVNNAGTFQMGAVTEMKLAQWQQVLDTNLTAAFLCSKHAAAKMIEKGRGHIFNIASIGGLYGFPNLSAYCSSKFGLRGLGKALSLELKPRGIRVTTIFPHNMNSAHQPIEADSPDRRQMIEVSDVASMIVHIASTPAHVDIDEITMFGAATRVTPGFD